MSNITAAQAMSTTLRGFIRLMDDGVEATIARDRLELEQFRTRTKNMFDYLPVAVSLAAEKAAAQGALSVCLVTLLDGDYEGSTSYEPGKFDGADATRLKGVGKRLYDLLHAAGLRPSLGVENRFNRGNGKRYDCLCLFVEVDPAAFK